MSPYMAVDQIIEVLPPDGWHPVDNQSFDLDSYEHQRQGQPLHPGGNSGICPTSHSSHSGSRRITGPLDAVTAVARAIPPTP